MTVLVSVKINDGVVMAADSASSFASGLIYHHAQKIVNLQKGLPIGAMVTGAGGIGNESIDTLLKDLRRRFSGKDLAYSNWKLDPASLHRRRGLGPSQGVPVRGEVTAASAPTSGPRCAFAATPPADRSPRSGRCSWRVPIAPRQHRFRPSRSSARDGMASTKHSTG